MVTFLFTDIEGSSARWEADPAAMRTALARHDATLSIAVDDTGGWLFKHTGDGVLAAFEHPGAAVEAAVRAQRELELPVRMGIATGPAEHRNDDYFGPVLNQAARVMSAGHGGQILLAASTAALVADVVLTDLGEHLLRGLSRPLRISQVRAPGLRDHFPALTTSTMGNLPVAHNRLIGREHELGQVAEALAGSRIVTLTGVGGVGKTRLALAVAERVQHGYPDGVWFVELASVESDDAVAGVMTSSTNVLASPGRDARAALLEVFASRRSLIVVDNCEHLVEPVADLVEELVGRCPGVTVLATSREALMVDGERSWPVPSLGVEAGTDSAGVELFVERAREVAPEWVADDEIEVVAEICRQVEGIPLAIELAAARIRSLGAVEIRNRLADRFRLLSGGRRRALERHQTLRHAIGWSFDLLAPAERVVLMRLAVCANGFGLRAAEAVCAGGDVAVDDVVDHLDSLVRKSLLSVDRGHEQIRYRQLETIRQFAEELLVQSGDADEARSRHARHFVAESDEMFEIFRSPQQLQAHQWVEREMENLGLAFSWSASGSDPDAAISLAANVGDVARFRLRAEAYSWPEQVLEMARDRGSPRLTAVLTWAASNAWGLGRFEDAQRYAEEALAVADEPGFDDLVWAHVDLAIASAQRGEVERAVDVARRGAAHPADLRDRMCLAFLPLQLAMVGRTDAALAAADEAIEQVERAGVPTALAIVQMARGAALRPTRPVDALAALGRALEICRANGIKMFELDILAQLAELLADQGDVDASLRHLDAMLTQSMASIDEGSLQMSLVSAAAALAGTGSSRTAAILLGWLGSRIIPERVAPLAHRLRSELDEHDFDDLVAAGEAMSRAEVVALAAEQVRRGRARLGPKPGD